MRLLRQRGPEIELHRAVARRHPKPDRDLGPYLITLTTNPHATMHYDVARCREAAPFEEINAAREHAARGAAPTSVNERDRACVGEPRDKRGCSRRR